jgi:hypothetical protein
VVIFLFFTLTAVERAIRLRMEYTAPSIRHIRQMKGVLMMVKHIILWKLKDEIADKASVKAGIKKFLDPEKYAKNTSSF